MLSNLVQTSQRSNRGRLFNAKAKLKLLYEAPLAKNNQIFVAFSVFQAFAMLIAWADNGN